MSNRTKRTNGDTTRPTFGALMTEADTVKTTKAGLNINSSGQAEIWDLAGNILGTSASTGLAQPHVVATSDILLNGVTGSAVSTGRKFVKTITGIADAAATDIATVTVPNAGHAALVKITFIASLGAGGTVGAYEANRSGEYLATISRVAGVAAVVVLSSVAEASTAAVAGATTIAATVTATAMTGAVGATNTFTFQTTITKGAGSSAAHQGVYIFEVLNVVASGITIA